MSNKRIRQTGAGAIGTAILLVVLAYGIFVAIQYAPQFIESSSIDSMLESISSIHHTDPAHSETDLERMIGTQLYANQMSDMREAFTVHTSMDNFVIDVDYDRSLNLIYETKKIHYHKSLSLPVPN